MPVEALFTPRATCSKGGTQSLPAPPNKEKPGPAPSKLTAYYTHVSPICNFQGARELECPGMPSSRKINLEKVRASLDEVCPKCGALIPPADVRRIDFERIECPLCGERFVPRP